ncbi:hypothetical protein Daura_23925 [Dactylosporangium aurantiacum]|uniref:Uncharacterized protein n=1 Tax=Dactylosporangium aurantiacum TaxID=35754 RepID=A0A9Q9MH20_9ACTN|nr:hypothetical protein [Dactylosporangium aurantiacum]MDG6103860.1 hypothetical protein [Dactylosporangium aurantiacum]UWZ58943.1 hypothetical protein Daura_23925 [Dactylosporangium aurantiacum]
MGNTKRRPTAVPHRRGGVHWVWIVLALAAGALLGGPIGAATADPRSDTQRSIDAIRAADAKRDAEQIVALTTQARQVRDALAPVLDAFAAAVPPGANAVPGPEATTDQVATWRTATTKAVEGFADPPSAGTGVNIARAGLAAATRTLQEAVIAYEQALRVPPASRAAQLTHAGQLRDIAVATWAVGGTQLDQLNVDAGHGHAHVFLPAVPGQGAMTSDGSPEGK